MYFIGVEDKILNENKEIKGNDMEVVFKIMVYSLGKMVLLDKFFFKLK